MPIRDWPAEERPREKLLARGAAALSDAELLAIFLRNGVKGKTAVDLAREMLSAFGSLRALLEVDPKTFYQTKGLGMAKYVQLQAVLEMSRRYLATGLLRGEAPTDPQAMRDYVRLRLQGYAHEVFACLFLDSRHRVISFEELFSGTINGTSVHPREVVKRALFHNAAAVIFAHNHPSGTGEPSHADQVLTRRLKEALALMEVRTLDHLVIGDTEAVSFAERGLL